MQSESNKSRFLMIQCSPKAIMLFEDRIKLDSRKTYNHCLGKPVLYQVKTSDNTIDEEI